MKKKIEQFTLQAYEDEILAKKANERLEKMKPEDAIDWDEACNLAGWDDKTKEP